MSICYCLLLSRYEGFCYWPSSSSFLVKVSIGAVRRWQVSAETIESASRAYGWPRAMAATIEAATRKASVELTQFQRRLKSDIIELQADIDDYSQQARPRARKASCELLLATSS